MIPRHVAYVSDAGYLPWCATSVRSLVDQHEPGSFVVHLVHDGSVGGAEVDALEAMVGDDAAVRVHAVDEGAVSRLPDIDRFGRIVWLRFALAELLPDVERVLYLDADTLVVDRVDGLLDTDLGGSPIGAVANVVPAEQWARVREIGVIDPAHFFNSGVLLMDLGAMRRESVMAQVADATSAFGHKIEWPDQDVLNIVYAGRWRRLHPRFNAQYSLFDWPDLATGVFGATTLREAVHDPSILHFEGPYSCKPWHRLSTHPWRDRYRAVLARTPWADAPLADDVVTTRAIAALPASWQLPVYRSVFRGRQSPKAEVRRLAGATKRAVRSIANPDPTKTTAPVDAVGGSRIPPHPLSAADDDRRTVVERCLPYTMGSIERLLATADATAYVAERGVPGALAECGVWRGGSVLAMVLTLLQHDITDRDIYLFDTFTGMTEPTVDDTSAFHPTAEDEWTRSRETGETAYGALFAESTYGLAQVQRLLHASGYPTERINFVEGPVEETIPRAAPEELALLRLDTDWYESTRHELEHLYPRLRPGGVLIIDDYGHWQGARKAADEYLEKHGPLLLCRSDYTGRMAVKP